MSLFQKSVLRKHLNELDKDRVNAAYAKFKAHFGDAKIQQNIRDAKEEEYQEGFVRDLFVNVFGYTLKPQPDYNFVLEKKNEKDSKKSDGAILQGEAVLAAVELKGTNTVDLDHVEAQAFGYKNNQKGCRYVVVSNFEKLRFYIDDSVEHLEWDLFTLSAEDFAVLYLCLQKDKLLANVPAAIKDASVNEEQSITKKLYKDYSTFKRLLYQNICAQNPAHDKVLVYKKTQKLLDRFLFILFAEDKQLLPPNSIREILKQWEQLKELDEHVPLYERYKKYFGYLNTGHKGKVHDIFAYNGGLFAADEVLDTIRLDDQLLYDSTFALSQYDFDTDVDVNILGHIFEHSLNDVDAVTAESEGRELEKEKTRRKKDGVFYTPKYITKYIVENTVGKLCAEKKTELEIKDEDYSGGKKKKDKKTLNEKLESYTKWLLQLTILDPACGSGAFLNQALEFLILEHKKVDDLRSKLFEDTLVLSDVENHILENNLYGVDLNEESIEIAKLSLWLRTAKKGRKLSSLNSNIKCGNSLIDDKAVAGDKAFVWKEEFKEVMGKGGFDVVVGNPPYVVLSSFENAEFEYLQNRYKTSFGRLNTFALFIEKCTELISKEGEVGLIIPDSLCLIDYYSDLRKYLLDKTTINKLIEIGNGIFDDATVPALVICFSGSPSKNHLIEIGTTKEALFGFHKPNTVEQNYYYKTPKNSFNLHIDAIFLKLNNAVDHKTTWLLHEILQIKIGVCTGNNKKHLSDSPSFGNSKMTMQGKNINRYNQQWEGVYMNYSREELLRARDESIFLKDAKLFMRQTSDSLILSYDDEQFYAIDSLFIIYPKNEEINLKYCLALLNSKLLNRQYQKLNPEAGRVFAQVKIDYVNELPIKLAGDTLQNTFIEKVDKMLSLNKELHTIQSQFLGVLQSKVALEKPSNKLQDWYKLEFKEFVKELEKAKVKLSLAETSEWMPFFNEQRAKAVALKNEIEKTDREIDGMVYGLYELSEEEIKIVEGC